MLHLRSARYVLSALCTLPLVALFGTGCSAHDGEGSSSNNVSPTPADPGAPYQPAERRTGQSEFVSAPPGSYGASHSGGVGASADAGTASEGAPSASGASDSAKNGGGATTRAVEETDLYRLDGNTLYYLNGYRGLMVFDVTDVDRPKLIGRSAIFGWPVEMIVRNGIAVIVVADWYGTMDDGTPFHGSVVRGLDARDPANIKQVGEARLGGWVRDTRIVGDVLYAVSEDNGYYYGYGGYGGVSMPKIVVSSVNFKGGQIASADKVEFPGWG